MNLKIFTVLAGALLAAACVQADGLTDEQQLFRALRERVRRYASFRRMLQPCRTSTPFCRTSSQGLTGSG